MKFVVYRDKNYKKPNNNNRGNKQYVSAYCFLMSLSLIIYAVFITDRKSAHLSLNPI